MRPSLPDQPAELQVHNPATEEVIATVPAATVTDVDAAVVRAARAQTAWAALAPGERARLLRRFAVTVDEHLEELARLEVREPIAAYYRQVGVVWDGGRLLESGTSGAE